MTSQNNNISIQRGKQIVEQISPNLNIVEDRDCYILKSEDKLKLFGIALCGGCTIEKYQNNSIFTYSHAGIKECFLVANITHLGKPHPAFKKRIQIKEWFKEYYFSHKDDTALNIRIIGTYYYDGLTIFADFSADDYMDRLAHNSSAHIYTNDLFQAVKNGIFKKTDANGNRISLARSDRFKEYIDNGFIEQNPIFNFFSKFNDGFQFAQWITAVRAIKEMKENNFYQWRATEWAGFFMEMKIRDFITEEQCEDIVRYVANCKSYDMLDFDLIFYKNLFYGDIKASNIDEKECILNDQNNVTQAILKHDRLFYIIFEHETVRDKDHNSEMAIERMKLLGEPYAPGKKISYQAKMKHSVCFRKMTILEINRANYRNVLRDFNQGHQPTGESRAPKFKIRKSDMENYVVYRYVR